MAQGQPPAQQQKMPNAAAPAAQPQMTAQQMKMKNCNAEASAKNLKGEGRNSFMSQCLKGGAAAPAMSAASTRQQGCTSQADAAEAGRRGADLVPEEVHGRLTGRPQPRTVKLLSGLTRRRRE